MAGQDLLITRRAQAKVSTGRLAQKPRGQEQAMGALLCPEALQLPSSHTCTRPLLLRCVWQCLRPCTSLHIPQTLLTGTPKLPSPS